jgi:O-antigen/teichoic acid export membrane protein
MLYSQKIKKYVSDHHFSSIFKGAAFVVCLRALGVGIRMSTFILLSRLLGTSGYGAFVYGVTWMTFFSIVSMLGLDHVIIKFVPKYFEHRLFSKLRGLMRFVNLTSLLTAVFVSIVSIIVFYNMSYLASDLRFSVSLTLFLVPIVTYVQILQVYFRAYHHSALGQIPEQIIYPILFLSMIFIGYYFFNSLFGLTYVLLANFFSWSIVVLSSHILLNSKIPSQIHTSYKEFSEKSLWIEMIPSMAFFALMFQLFSRIPTFFLGLKGTASDVGIYAVSSRIAECIDFIYAAAAIVGASLFSKTFFSEDQASLQRFTSKMVSIIFWFTLPVYLILMVCTPWILALFGPEFHKSGVMITRILLTANFLGCVGGFVESKLSTMGHQRDVASVIAIMALIMFVFSWSGIHYFGILGAAVASASCIVLYKGSLIFRLYKKTGLLAIPFIK